MSNLWYPKQQPIAGLAGLGGGATSLAFSSSGFGGDPTANKSVLFDNSHNDWLEVGPSNDFKMGTGDFCIECFVQFDNNDNQGVWQLEGIISNYPTTMAMAHNASTWHGYQGGGTWNYGSGRNTGQWYHTAYTRSGSTNRIFIDGTQIGSFTNSYDYTGTTIGIGGYYSASSYTLTGWISNFRVVKGQAIYTSNFTPATSMLTTTSQGATASNVKLLCCQNTTVTGATVSPAEVVANGSGSGPDLSSEHPF